MNGILRSARGVQRDEVWQAADALLQEGKRPTIERVRLKLGRGSPNTVSPMLEEWFATLGPRLRGAGGGERPGMAGAAVASQAAEEGAQGRSPLPEPLRQAMHALWQGAVEEAGQAAQQALQARMAALEERENQLAQERAALQAEREAFEQQRPALEQALASAHAQARLQGVRIAELEAAAAHKDATITRQAERAQQLEREVLLTRRSWDEAREKHAAEQRAQQQQMDAQNRHHLQELDRVRQEVKQLLQSQRQEQEQHLQQQALWQRERSELQAELERAQAQVAAGTRQLKDMQALHAAQGEAEAARTALLQQQLAQWQARAEAAARQASSQTDAQAGEGRAVRRPLRPAVTRANAAAAPRPGRLSLRRH
ncbi:MAG: DNA-binding protein [Comamonas sp.]